MSWLRLDDKIATHRKTVQVGNEAFGAWVRMAAHCQGHGTDGRITRAEALVFGSEDIISRLLHVGFLDAVDGEPDVFEVHDLLHWNFTAEEAKARREKRAIAGKLGGKRSAEVRRHLTTRSKRQANAKQTASKVQANAEANAEVGAKQNATPSPNPINTNPLYSPSKQAEARDSVIRLRPSPSPSPSPSLFPTVETKTLVGSPEPTGVSADEDSNGPDTEAVRDVFAHWLNGWRRVAKGREPKLDQKRRGKVRARMREGYTVDDLKRAIDGMFSTPWNLENKFWDLELVCRDAAHVDRFATVVAQNRPSGVFSVAGSTRNPSGRLAPYHKPFTDDD